MIAILFAGLVMAEAPDRSQPPVVVPPEPMVLDEPTVVELAPGVTLHHVRIPGVRLVDIRVLLGRGTVALEGRSSMAGRAMGDLADVAVGELASDELSILEDLYDLDVWSTGRLYDGVLGVEAPPRELGRAIDLLGQLLRAPSYPSDEIAQWVRNQRRNYTVRFPASQSAVAQGAANYGWWPATSPYGARPDLDELAAVVDPEPLVALHRRWLAESPLQVLVVGDVGLDEVREPLQGALEGLGVDVDRARDEAATPPTGRTVFAVDMPGQDQVAIRLRMAAPPRLDEQRVVARLTTHVLGGHFLSRLNANLREEKGWTYGARASWRGGDGWGLVSAGVDVRSEQAMAAVVEIEGELARIVAEGIPVEELEISRRLLVQDWNETRTTADDAASRYAEALTDERSLASAQADYAALAEITPEQVQAFATPWFGEDAGRMWVFVGDRTALEPQLAERGWTATWLTPQQAVLGQFEAAFGAPE